uniref:Uncharacterized protein n=1 Tax=Glossina austeni TaxID=7395 RepID=A0A1A9US06_GLOAU
MDKIGLVDDDNDDSHDENDDDNNDDNNDDDDDDDDNGDDNGDDSDALQLWQSINYTLRNSLISLLELIDIEWEKDDIIYPEKTSSPTRLTYSLVALADCREWLGHSYNAIKRYNPPPPKITFRPDT